MANASAEAIDERPVVNVAEIVDNQKLGAFNIGLIVLGWIAIFADGYDIADLSYALPEVSKAWGLKPPDLGFILSASLWSYVIGAVSLGFVSDRWGRRRALITGCLIFGLFSFASMFATSATSLFAMRFMTGVGLGGTIPSVVAVGAEFAPRRVRAMLVILSFSGINMGSAIAGFLAPTLLSTWGWQAIFFVGGLIPTIAAILVFFLMPESIKFMTLHGGYETQLRRVLKIIGRGVHIPENARFIVGIETKKENFRPSQLFAGSLKFITPLLWFMFVLNFLTTYFLSSWFNIVFRAAGMSIAQAAYTSSMYTFVGMFGGWVIATFVDRFGMLAVAVWGVLSAVAVTQIGTPGLGYVGVAAMVGLTGFGVQGVQYGLNATPGLIYPTSYRANGLGWAFGISRVGAVAGPILGGYLVDMKLPMQQLFYFPAIPLVLGVICALIQAKLCYGRFRSLQMDERPAAAST